MLTLSLSVIEGADPDAVLKYLQDCKTCAADLVTTAETYQAKVRLPGGQTWTGETADAAQRMAAGDHAAIDTLRGAVDALADNASASMTDNAAPKLAEVRRLIDEARAAGLTVNEDLSLTFANVCPTPTAQAEAEGKARRMQAAARSWWQADCEVATQIAQDGHGLSANFKTLAGHTVDVGGAAVTFAAGTLARLGLELRMDATAPRALLPRNQLVEILNPLQSGRHVLPQNQPHPKLLQNKHVKVPANAATMARVGRFLGPVGSIAGVGAEYYGNQQAVQAGEMTQGEATGDTIGSVGGGVVGGLAAGALVGSAFGPVGTAVGAGIGAVVGSEFGGWAGKKLAGLFN